MKHNKLFFTGLLFLLLQLLCEVSFARTEIKGKINNCTGCRISVLIDNSGLELDRDTLPSSPDSYGNFVFDLLNVHKPTVVLLQVNQSKVPIYVEPNKKTWVNINYQGHYFDYTFENELATENNLLKEFNNKFGWITNNQPGNIYVNETTVNVKGNLMGQYNAQPEYLRADHLTALHKQMRDEVVYMNTSNEKFKKFMTTYANHASSATVYSMALKDRKIYTSDLGRILSLSYSDSFNDIDKGNPAFYPHLKAYGIFQSHASGINMANFNEYFDFASRNMQVPSRLKEQYLIYMLKKNLNGANVVPMQSTILDFARQMTDLDNMANLMTLYTNVKKKANGRKAPNFMLEDKNGNMVSLQSLQGKNVFLAFWSSTCRPCIEGMKKSIENKYYLQGDDIKFVYISTDFTKSTWLANTQVQNAGPNDVHLWAGKGAIDSKEYDAFTLPTYYFINRYGNFISEFPKSWEPNFVNFVRSVY